MDSNGRPLCARAVLAMVVEGMEIELENMGGLATDRIGRVPRALG